MLFSLYTVLRFWCWKSWKESFLSVVKQLRFHSEQETFPIKKFPVTKHGGIFLFHLIVIVLIQASCKVEEGRGVGGVD